MTMIVYDGNDNDDEYGPDVVAVATCGFNATSGSKDHKILLDHPCCLVLCNQIQDI